MADVKAKPKTKAYVLTGRSHDGFDSEGNRKTFVEGDTVQLTEAQFESFKDKFEDQDGKDKSDTSNRVESPTKPESNTDPDKKNVQSAPKAPETKPEDHAKGAGAAQNSSNTAKV